MEETLFYYLYCSKDYFVLGAYSFKVNKTKLFVIAEENDDREQIFKFFKDRAVVGFDCQKQLAQIQFLFSNPTTSVEEIASVEENDEYPRIIFTSKAYDLANIIPYKTIQEMENNLSFPPNPLDFSSLSKTKETIEYILTLMFLHHKAFEEFLVIQANFKKVFKDYTFFSLDFFPRLFSIFSKNKRPVPPLFLSCNQHLPKIPSSKGIFHNPKAHYYLLDFSLLFPSVTCDADPIAIQLFNLRKEVLSLKDDSLILIFAEMSHKFSFLYESNSFVSGILDFFSKTINPLEWVCFPSYVIFSVKEKINIDTLQKRFERLKIVYLNDLKEVNLVKYLQHSQLFGQTRSNRKA